MEYEPSPSSSKNSKSSAVSRPLTELLRDLEGARDAGGFKAVAWSSSGMPSSRVKYAGGREPRGVVGDCGLRDLRLVRGAEKFLRGLGRTGVWRGRSRVELEEDEEEMAEAFLLSSARVGVAGWDVSGDGEETWSLSIRGGRASLLEEGMEEGKRRKRERKYGAEGMSTSYGRPGLCSALTSCVSRSRPEVQSP